MKMNNVTSKNIKVGVAVDLPPNLPTTFQYIKFEVTDNNGNSLTTVGDISYVIGGQNYPSSAMTGFATPGVEEVYDYSSYYQNNSTYEPWKAFDNLTYTNNRWLFDSSFPQFVSLDLSSSYNTSDFGYIKILPGNHNADDYTDRAIKDFNVYISDDNETWYSILEETEVTEWESGVEKIFYINF